MKKIAYHVVMNIKSAHSVMLQYFGYSKEYVRSTLTHKRLVAVAYHLCKSM